MAWKKQIASIRNALCDEGFLSEQFLELEKLEDDPDNPVFMRSILNMFFNDDLPKNITCIEQLLKETGPLDLVKLNSCIFKLKGGSVSIGAKRVHAETVNMMGCCREDHYIDIGGIRAAFSRLKEEIAMLKDKLQPYLELLRADAENCESAASNNPIFEGTSTSGDKDEVRSNMNAD